MPANKHLDAATVTRFCARTLSADERARAFEHLVCCDDCRDWVTSYGDMTAGARARPRIPIFVAALAACAVAFAYGAIIHFSPFHPMEAYVQEHTLIRKTAGRAYRGAVRLRPHVEHDAALPASRITTAATTLPPAWRSVRLTSFAPPTPAPDQIALYTSSGERWITMPKWSLVRN